MALGERTLVLLAFASGLGMSELFALKWVGESAFSQGTARESCSEQGGRIGSTSSSRTLPHNGGSSSQSLRAASRLRVSGRRFFVFSRKTVVRGDVFEIGC